MSRIEFQIAEFKDALPEQFPEVPDNEDDWWGYYCLFIIRINGKRFYLDRYFDVFYFLWYVDKWKKDNNSVNMYFESKDYPFIAFISVPGGYRIDLLFPDFECTDIFSKQEICEAIDVLSQNIRKMINGEKECLSLEDTEAMLKSNGYEYSIEGNSERVIRIKSPNGHYDLSIIFQPDDNSFILEDMYFGHHCFEYGHICCDKEVLLRLINEDITNVMSGKLKVIVKYSKKGSTVTMTNEKGCLEYYKVSVRESSKPRNILEVLFNIHHQYEIYDWFSYELITR